MEEDETDKLRFPHELMERDQVIEIGQPALIGKGQSASSREVTLIVSLAMIILPLAPPMWKRCSLHIAR